MVQTITGTSLKGEIDVLIELNEAHDALQIATVFSESRHLTWPWFRNRWSYLDIHI